MSREGSSGRLPIGQGVPVAVLLADGTLANEGWQVVEVWRDGVAVVHLGSGQEFEMGWDALLQTNPTFSPDDFLRALAAVTVTEAEPPAPIQAPSPEHRSLWERLADRSVNVPRSNGRIEREGWRITDLNGEGIKATNDVQEVDKWLSWGQLLLHNEHLLPLNTTVKTPEGHRAYFKGVSGTLAAYEAFAAYQGSGVRSRELYQQEKVEDIETFAQRNCEYFGQPPIA